MLTRESTPIIKNNLPSMLQNFNEETDNKYFLFVGTKIVQKSNFSYSMCIGIYRSFTSKNYEIK